jgi:hypothetical protein
MLKISMKLSTEVSPANLSADSLLENANSVRARPLFQRSWHLSIDMRDWWWVSLKKQHALLPLRLKNGCAQDDDGPARKPNCTTTEIQNRRKPNLDGFSRKTSDRQAYKRNQKEKW